MSYLLRLHGRSGISEVSNNRTKHSDVLAISNKRRRSIYVCSTFVNVLLLLCNHKCRIFFDYVDGRVYQVCQTTKLHSRDVVSMSNKGRRSIYVCSTFVNAFSCCVIINVSSSTMWPVGYIRSVKQPNFNTAAIWYQTSNKRRRSIYVCSTFANNVILLLWRVQRGFRGFANPLPAPRF